MKKLILTLTALAATFTVSGAEVEVRGFGRKLTLNPQNHAYYQKGEFQIDLFGGYASEAGKSIKDGDALGGAGLTWFPTVNFGLGVEASAGDSTGMAVDNVGYSFYARVPINRVAIYTLAGASHATDSWGELRPHVGGGAEYRFSRNWGLFGEGRAVSDADGNWGSLARGGVRLSF